MSIQNDKNDKNDKNNKNNRRPVAFSRIGVSGLLVALLATISFSTSAHEFWIETESLPIGNLVDVQLRVGDGFPGELFPRSSAHIQEFFVEKNSERQDVSGREGYTPAGRFSAAQEGVYLVGYRSGQTAITLKPEDFEAYLAEEGLEHIIRLRQQRGETGEPGREVYSRAAKYMLHVGSKEAPQNIAMNVGFDLEIVPLINQGQLMSGDSLKVQVLYQSEPLPGVMLSLFDAAHPQGDRSRRTDDKGYVDVPLSSSGRVMLGVVHMVASNALATADWESIWASLTFQIPIAEFTEGH